MTIIIITTQFLFINVQSQELIGQNSTTYRHNKDNKQGYKWKGHRQNKANLNN